MDNMIYLLNMTISGIKSLKKEIHLEFYKKTVDKRFNPDKYRIKAIYGENGSGKSAIITAVKIFKDILLKDNYISESKTQTFLNEIINKTSQTFCFSCEFLVDSGNDYIVYSYSIELGRNDNGIYEIKSEIFKCKNGNYVNNNYVLIFESKNGELINSCSSKKNKELFEKKSLNLLSSHSFISICIKNFSKNNAVLDIEKEDKDLLLHLVIGLLFAAILKVYLAEEDEHEIYFLRKKLKESQFNSQVLQEGLSEYLELINGFSSVNEKVVDKRNFSKYKEKIGQLTQFIKIFKSELVSIDIDRKENGNQYECELNLNYGEYVINKEFESTGIKKLIRLFDCFMAASTNGIVFVDEMDSNINDVYLCKIIEYFMYYGKGQLCFTTHNLDPMTVLKANRNSIDFLSSDNHLVSWASRGNASPEKCYKNGMIEDSPFNIDSTDFIGIFGES